MSLAQLSLGLPLLAFKEVLGSPWKVPGSFHDPFGLKVHKSAKKALAFLKDHLERPLKPIQGTQMTTESIWTSQKRFEVFLTSNKD